MMQEVVLHPDQMGRDTSPDNFIHREILGGQQTSIRSYAIELDNGSSLNFYLESTTKMPWITAVEGEPFLEDARILDINVRALGRTSIGLNDVVDTKAVIIKTTRGVCRIKYAHEHPKGIPESPEVVWTFSS